MAHHVRIFRSGSPEQGDCSLHGISSWERGADALYVLDHHEVIPDKLPSIPMARLMPGNVAGSVKIVPEPAGGKWWMFGGHFAYSGDSRFNRAVEAISGSLSYGAVPIHDRCEG